MPHILVAGKIHEAGVVLLKSASGITFELIEDVSLDSYAPLAPKADALVIRTQPLTAAVIANAVRLKIVSRHGVGYDAVDIPALNARGIPLTIVGDVNSRAVAEHAVMLMLATSRNAVAHDAATRIGDWPIRNRFETTELDGKKLLLFGFGRIGRRVARLAKAFDMDVLAYDPFGTARIFKDHPVKFMADLDRALGVADYISLHMPGSGSGPVLGARELALLKNTAIVINTARGDLIDELALDAALQGGRLAAAGLDVFAAEPPGKNNPLLNNPRVTLSPHSAGLTDETASRMAIVSVQNVLDFFAGQLDPQAVVNAGDIAFPR